MHETSKVEMGLWLLMLAMAMAGAWRVEGEAAEVRIGRGVQKWDLLGSKNVSVGEDACRQWWVEMRRREQIGKEVKVSGRRKLGLNVEKARPYKMNVYAGLGQFLTVLRIGTPLVSFTAIVDTGSDLVWRQCRPCKRCYPQAHDGFTIFDPSRSSTFRKAPCSDPLCQQVYGSFCSPHAAGGPVRTCSYDSPYDDPQAFTRGDLAFDTLSLSDSSGRSHLLPNFAFGCSHESHGPYNFAGSGGIVGFGQGNLSLPSQLHISKFSYCFRRITAWSIDPAQRQPSPSLLQHSSLSPSLASPLFLGDAAHLNAGPDIQSTRIVDRQSYIVNLLAIRVAGRRLHIPRSLFRDGGTLIDSGTTFTTLPTIAFRAVYSAFRARIPLTPWHSALTLGPRNLSLCYSSLPSPMPSLSFHFKGAHLRLAPHNYFVFIDNLYCLAILETEDSGVVYGNVQQQDFHILYNLQSRLISFKPTSCSSLHHT